MKKMIQIVLVIAAMFAAGITKAQCIANAGTNKSICCPGGTVTLGASPTGTSSCSGMSYIWSPATGLSNVNAANPVASPSVTTVYTVCIVGYAAPSCTSICCTACKTVTVTVNSSCCRINPNASGGGKQNTGFHIYPNPASHDITLEVEQALPKGEFRMTDVTGKDVLIRDISNENPQTLKVDVSQLPRGVYLIKVRGADNELYSGKVVLE
ncbi:MAG: T9SS type A sorting domain-containing protein [Bacteroidetes bacterium]|nr:T9SS type A sorting domain-containing protein [Bacteroidota bacterium]